MSAALAAELATVSETNPTLASKCRFNILVCMAEPRPLADICTTQGAATLCHCSHTSGRIRVRRDLRLLIAGALDLVVGGSGANLKAMAGEGIGPCSGAHAPRTPIGDRGRNPQSVDREAVIEPRQITELLRHDHQPCW